MSSDKLKQLAKYSVCDISDALLKLEVPGAGYLADITPLNASAKIIAPATTVLFVPRTSGSFPSITAVNSDISHQVESFIASNIRAGSVYSDLITPGTIVVLSQPTGSITATMGSVHAARMHQLGAKGILVDGRVRDVQYLKEDLDLPIWSKSTSIVATKGECKAHAINVPIDIGRTRVTMGDIIILDPLESGAVCIPKDRLDQVLELVPEAVEKDNNIMADVLRGVKVEEATKKYG